MENGAIDKFSYDGSSFLSSVEVFDPARNEWHPVTPMMVTEFFS